MAGATEKRELVAALAERLATCPICLEEAADGEPSQRCDGCRALFHRQCAGQHALAAAQAGRLPLVCPLPSCRERWRAPLVAWALDEAELQRYNTAVRGVRELRGGNGGVRSATPSSPRTAERLKQLGVRGCPKCGALIEKQAAGFTHGCNKMTCRCGCMFCFRCGELAGPGGAPRCSCVGAHHGYLSHEEVMRNYAGDPLGGQPTGAPGGVPNMFPFTAAPFGPVFGASAGSSRGMPLGAGFEETLQGLASAIGMGDMLGEAWRVATGTSGSSNMPRSTFR